MLVTPIATGSVTLQSLINVLGGFSSLGYTVFGYNDGAGMPDATTQADIDALIALGIPEARIAWVDLGTLEALTVADVSSASSIANLVLSQSGGVFAVADVSSASSMENLILTSPDVLVFTIQDVESATEIGTVVLTQSGGVFAITDAESLSEIENVTITSVGLFVIAAAAAASEIANVVMTQHGGIFTVATVSSASGVDNVEITEQAPSEDFSDFYNAATDVSNGSIADPHGTNGWVTVDAADSVVSWSNTGGPSANTGYVRLNSGVDEVDGESTCTLSKSFASLNSAGYVTVKARGNQSPIIMWNGSSASAPMTGPAVHETDWQTYTYPLAGITDFLLATITGEAYANWTEISEITVEL
jgi:hypothetical protein